MSSPDDYDRERKRILRRLDMITWGLAGAALLLAVLGGALIAWIVTGAGFPFLRTWVILSLLLLAVPLLVHVAPKPWRKDEDI